MKKKKFVLKRFVITIITILLTAVGLIALYEIDYWNLLPKKSYTGEYFGIETIKSEIDYNNNGIDDYTDIMLGARAYVENKPVYKSKYYEGGYPPDGIGVCTDVIWKAFENAGYSLKDLVDADISKNLDCYTTITVQDANIDFRRVKNLKIFFARNAQSLTLDPNDIAEWQPGDIVIYPGHIAIVSDKRSRIGRAYIIHHGGQPILEEDALTRREIVGHYRWVPGT